MASRSIIRSALLAAALAGCFADADIEIAIQRPPQQPFDLGICPADLTCSGSEFRQPGTEETRISIFVHDGSDAVYVKARIDDVVCQGVVITLQGDTVRPKLVLTTDSITWSCDNSVCGPPMTCDSHPTP